MEKDEQHPPTTKTFSDDELEDENDNRFHDNVDDMDDDDQREEDSSFVNQHWMAIVIALVASMVAHVYNHSSIDSLLPIVTNTFLPPLQNSMEKHNHLQGFVRTANISFCNDESRLRPLATGRLKLMDFYLSKDQFPALATIYLADQQDQVDNYEAMEQRSNDDSLDVVDPYYQCLLDQYQKQPSDVKIRGHTYYFKNPSIEEIYPHHMEVKGVVTGGGEKGVMMSSKERKRRLQQPPLTFTGFAAKFFNLSPKPILLYWDGKGGLDASKRLVAEVAPFESVGTATTPGQSFHVTAAYDSSTALQRWVVTADTALLYYEPMSFKQMKRILLDDQNDYESFAMYQRQLINQAFARDYGIASGRTWLGNFPRQFPIHYMHPADYIGQEHSVGDLTLKVSSVAPRVLTIQHFLTQEECHEIIRLGIDKGLTPSTLHSSATARETSDTTTRSSTNTWLARDTSQLTEKIYQRAAFLTKINPQLFQKFHETSAQHHSIAESLQIVRYRKGEEYSPHHDFVSPSINERFQGTRFATLLIYLNTVTEGGETRFPRAVNNHNAEGLEIAPEAGTAVLFYNMLEDGNVDDLSQHGSNKVIGNTNKWIANLWIWDPVIG